MKNDIDSLLDALFPNGRLQPGPNARSRAARDAEAFLKRVESGKKETDDALQQSLTDLSRVQAEAERSLQEMRRLLNDDGAAAPQPSPKDEKAEKKTGAQEPPADPALVFQKARDSVGEEIIGQDAFLNALFAAFRRPSVTGTAEGRPAAVIAVSGKDGTGRHSAVRVTAGALQRGGALKNGRIASIDLSLYDAPDTAKLLIQDLYAAIRSGDDVILFENFERCHPSLLPMLSSLAETGTLRLSSRYALQKGMLIDVGTALVPNAVSELRLSGQYLVFLTEKDRSAFADAFGAPFLNAVTDFCATGDFSEESLLKIGRAALEELAERAKARLGFALRIEEGAAQCVAAKFSRKDGVESIDRMMEDLFRKLSEEKLRCGVKDAEGAARAEDGTLALVFPSFTVHASEEKPAIDSTAVESVKRELQRVVGLEKIKDYVLSLEQNYIIQRLREERGMKADVPTMHMIFTGNPGTGKTTIARLVAKYLKAMGALSGGQLVEVTRADLVGRYVGHTAPLTRQVIRSALGGVLFIDEAYSLWRGEDDSFGLEAIDTLVKGMEDNRRDLIVILAGYSREMETFLEANSGLRSRFPNVIEFPDYTAEELLAITNTLVEDKGYALSPDCAAPLLAYYEKRQREDAKSAGNGRMARNLVEEAILRQSRRLTAGDVSRLTKEQLETLLPEDFDTEDPA